MTVEWVIVSLLLLIAVVPLGKKLRSRWAWGAVTALICLAAGGGWLWQNRLQARERSRSELLIKTPRQGRPGGYVSSDVCKSCHPNQYTSWHDSFHRTMTQYASPAGVRGNFDHATIRYEGEDYHFERRGDEFWVEMVDPDWKYVQTLKREAWKQGRGPAPTVELNPPRRQKRVGLLTGSHHMQAYWVWSDHGNMQFSLPFTYLFEAERWVPRNDVFLFDPNKPWVQQVWNVNCINCHATGGQPRQDQKTFVIDTRTAELGISCEACHGPAEDHVRRNSDPAHRYALHRDKKPDLTIFNPAHADHLNSAQTCGQCHAIRHKPSHNEWNAAGYVFRPGGDLEAIAPLVLYDDKDLHQPGQEKKTALMEGSFWSDGQVRVSGRDYNGMAASACFQRGEMSCLSCHSMHQYTSNDDQLGADRDGNQACLQCHNRYVAKLEEHTHHRAGSSGSLCYNCHMPHTSYGLLKAIRSHKITSPTVRESVATGRPNACNLCHLDQSLGWTATKLNEWYQQPPTPSLSPEEQTTSAAVRWLLTGDAGQRALIAWHMGWQPAKTTSGSDWLAPYLAEMLQDPYSVVRYIAQRSLKRLPGYENFSYDYIAAPDSRADGRDRALQTWQAQTKASAPTRASLLIESGGTLQKEKVTAWLKQRNNRSLELLE
jgi:predicted CXXCH cytochrome family protein